MNLNKHELCTKTELFDGPFFLPTPVEKRSLLHIKIALMIAKPLRVRHLFFIIIYLVIGGNI